MGRRILIVDDEPNIVLSLEFLMKKAGFQVESVTDGRAVLERLHQPPPDLVILDIMLPGMDGFELLRRLKATPGWDRARVILLTARGRESERERGLKLGADLYVIKPFSTRELVRQVEALLAAEESSR